MPGLCDRHPGRDPCRLLGGAAFSRQLRLHVPGLGNHEAWPLPRRSRRDHAPRLEPVPGLLPVDDPRMLPAAVRGQLALFPVRRRLERAAFHRFTARSWPEEDALTQLARESAAARGLSPTWPGMVMRLVRLALALRDANGEVLVAEEVLDQVNLPLKEAAGEMLARAGLLRPRTGPRAPVWPVRGCEDCGCFGITASRCAGCQCWRGDPTRYPLGRCPRCARDGLAVHRVEGMCRGCLVYVREYGDTAGPHAQLTLPARWPTSSPPGPESSASHPTSSPVPRHGTSCAAVSARSHRRYPSISSIPGNRPCSP